VRISRTLLRESRQRHCDAHRNRARDYQRFHCLYWGADIRLQYQFNVNVCSPFPGKMCAEFERRANASNDTVRSASASR
jgi:hypothetical protein